ncbi:NADH-quinone oxidoreductase subunit J [Thalassotalea psychrophila]|uniref:NADH-quinone oxidoreductase subunit J n=1 Tax=Thalassotalea psychrophila TaxID=3065647 RepID=A0ABY9TR02_9GAMM|nr:NADH-quinone oxidoreductase subunit J [Colwelliaceae bacterium SQ149]
MISQLPFYIAAAIAIIASIRVVTGSNAIHALLYLVVSLLAVAVCFYFMGAPFAAGLEVIVYAGAILVLFVFAVMMFDLQGDKDPIHYSKHWFSRWIGPVILSSVLLIEVVYVIINSANSAQYTSSIMSAKQVGILLYGPYLLAVEIASFLLLAGLIAGYHFAKGENDFGQGKDNMGGNL